ncbi:MAG: Flp pilus assembly protein CpaB [Mariniblastus sp.]|nr:Flp pilus assembly protein CpaB [Mariniblastus sp.]
MKSKSLVLLMVSLGFGVIAAVGISKVMGSGSAVRPAIKMGPVLVATTPLDHGTLLNGDNLKVENWPVQIIPDDAATDLEMVKNMAITTRLSKGLAILKADMVNKSEIRNLAIPGHLKVVGIKVSADDTLNGLLAPGDKVDVIGVVRVEDDIDGRKDRTVSETFLKGITVFSVNENMRAGGARELSKAKNSSIVSLLVDERQSEMIVLIQQVATLKLVLRGQDFDDDSKEVAGTQEYFMSLFGLDGSVTGNTPRFKINPNDEKHTMRIYNGQSAQTFEFKGNEPIADTQTIDTNSVIGDDPDDYDRFNEIESGLEEN